MSLKDIVNEEVAQALANNYDKLMKSKINISNRNESNSKCH